MRSHSSRRPIATELARSEAVARHYPCSPSGARASGATAQGAAQERGLRSVEVQSAVVAVVVEVLTTRTPRPRCVDATPKPNARPAKSRRRAAACALET